MEQEEEEVIEEISEQIAASQLNDAFECIPLQKRASL